MSLFTQHRPWIGALTICSSAFICSPASAQTIGNTRPGNEAVTVITPEKKVNPVKSAAIDDERFEVGAFAGFISIPDFDTNAITGISGSVHIDDRFMVGLSYASSDAAHARFEEELDVNVVQDREQGFSYLSANGSYKLFKMRSYWGKHRKFNSRLYIDLGLEQVSFSGADNFGFSLGLNYKTVLTDWLTANLYVKDHVVEMERNWANETKPTQNLEVSFGLNALF